MNKGFLARTKVCFKLNGVRCVVGQELDNEIAYMTARAAALVLRGKKFFVGRDMRISSHGLRDAFIKGLRESGVDVIDLGQVDTPTLYFASGKYNTPGAMITASHNPAKYNGIKLVDKGARPVGKGTGLEKIRKLVETGKFSKKKLGSLKKRDLSSEYRKHVLSFINLKKIERMKIVVDAGNGMAGKIIPSVYKGLPISVKRLGFKLDGRFPNHVANPIRSKNTVHLRQEVKKSGAELGIAFDADMDRVVFVDERGRAVDSSALASLIIKSLLNKKKGAVVYNVAMSRSVPEIIRKFGGRAYRERVGHTAIKTKMRKEKAEFGCEHSAHCYYKKNWYADSGIITSLIVLELYSKAKKEGRKFSDLLSEFRKRDKIEEKSFTVSNKERLLKKIEAKYKKRAKKVRKIDGLTMEFEDWWFNLRASNTEPLLRVNLEAENRKLMLEKEAELIKLIKN